MGNTTPARAGSYLGASGVAARRALLSAERPLPTPPWLAFTTGQAAQVGGMLTQLCADADRDGASAIALDRPLTPVEFLAVGERLGRPIPEWAGAVDPFVRNRFILDLVVRFGITDDVDRQPFSRSPLLLHSEGSRRALADQPRHLVFNCVEPSPAVLGGQTVIVRNQDVIDRLSAECREVLCLIRYAGDDGAPILRWERSRPVFCFRDFGDDPLAWEAVEPIPSRTVDNAFDELVAAAYHPEILTGLTWSRHQLMLLDNRHLLHGRTAFPERDDGAARRHLQRIRLLPPG